MTNIVFTNCVLSAAELNPKLPTNWQEVALSKKWPKKSIESHTESTCPECHHVLLESLVCSTCDNCTLCGDLEARSLEASKIYSVDRGQQDHPPPESHQSHEVLAEVHREEHNEKDTLNEESRNLEHNSSQGGVDENQLRRQLKQAFGQVKPIQTNQIQTSVSEKLNVGSTGVVGNGKTHPIYEPISELEHNVEYDVDFLSEYAQKTSLYHVEVGAAPVLSKHGHTMAVTEDMFRGDIEGTLKKVVKDLDVDQQRRNHKGASPELNNSDSGIASPPPDDELSMPTLKFSKIDLIAEEENDAANDSGMDDQDKSKSKKVIIPGTKPPNTMIRELKSRLKEKFQQDEIYDQQGSKNQNKNNVVYQELSHGTVESRKMAMEPKFAKLFAARSSKSANIPSTGSIADSGLMTTWSKMSNKCQQTNHNDHDLCSDCGEPLENENTAHSPTSEHLVKGRATPTSRPPTREMLYAPGGLFGPKGPFSTPHVRYPNGMELPNRKASRAPSRVSAAKTPNPYVELSSVCEDRSVKSSYTMNAMITRPFSPEMNSKPPSRMETYKADWSELPYEDIDHWQEEKAKRMLAWIHTLHGSEHIGTQTPWWKVDN